jgi:hypothetical protein
MNVIDILSKVTAESYLNHAPKLKKLLTDNPEAMQEYIAIIKKARYTE